MFNLLGELISATSIPLFVLFVFSFVLLLKLNPGVSRFLLLSFVFSFTWRLFFFISSSRYCIVFVVYSFLALLFVCHYAAIHFKKRGYLLCGLIFSAVILLNVITLNRPFNNIYIDDARDIVQKKLMSSDHSRVYIDQKEYGRIRVHDEKFDNRQGELLWSISKEWILPFLSEQSLSGDPLFVFCSERTDSDSYNKLVSPSKQASLNKICEFRTNRKGVKRFCIYSFVPPVIPICKTNEDINKPDNLIVNGNIEKIQDKATTRKQLSKWISSGITFYDDEKFSFPSNQMILWPDPPSENYPEVFADSEKAINGSYSLNVSLAKNNKSIIFLMNTIPSVPGKLSFLIRNLGNNPKIGLARWDHTDNRGVTAPFSTRVFYLHDHEPHLIELTLNQEDYHGKDNKSVFFFFGDDCNFLVDDISFVPF